MYLGVNDEMYHPQGEQRKTVAQCLRKNQMGPGSLTSLILYSLLELPSHHDMCVSHSVLSESL